MRSAAFSGFDSANFDADAASICRMRNTVPIPRPGASVAIG